MERPDGIRVASPPRTLFDSADLLGISAARSVMEQILNEKMCGLETIIDTFTRLAHPRRPGTATMAAVIASRPKWRRALHSDLEEKVLEEIERQHLPLATTQCPVQLPCGDVIHLDFKSRDMNEFGRDNGSTVQTNTDAQTGALTGYTIDPDGPATAPSFTFANPDFNLRSLRGTGVLRWEYRQGSTLYFVWTQERDGFDQFGDFNFNRDRSALFRDRPTNIFQIRGTYWIGR